MPRKRQAAYEFRKPDALTQTQHDILRDGFPMFPDGGADFESEAEARAAWNVHRAELMTEITAAGRRPAGFYRYDLGITEALGQWFEEVAILEARGLLTREEELRLVQDRHALDPDQGEEDLHPRYLAASIEHSARDRRPVDAMEWGFRRDLAEEQFIAAWHERRGRSELAAKYRERAALIERALERLKGEHHNAV